MSAVIDASLTFSVFEEGAANQPMYTNQRHSELVFHRFSLLRAVNGLTDAVISSKNGKKFNVHRVVMAGTSEFYFNHLLNADEPENVDTLSLNIDSEALETIITFCYFGGAELSVDNVGDVLCGAKKLQIESLVALCREMLEETLNDKNCIRFLEIADREQFDVLRDKSLAIITDVYPNVTLLPEFFNLTEQQIVWLLRLLLSDQDELFCSLLESLNDIENSFPALSLDDKNRSIVRASFIVGFLARNNLSLARSLPQLQGDEDDKSRSESNCGSYDLSELETYSGSDTEFESDTDFEDEDQQQPVHVLGIFKRRTVQFKQFCGIQRKWEKLSGKIELPQGIESFRDAIMIPFDKQIVILHTQNGSVSQAQCLTLKTISVESITLPHDIESANLTLFCPLSDQHKIYCFAGGDQQHFFGYDLKSKLWSRGIIDNVKVAKYIVGLKGELYFLGCGFNRTWVRSYHLDTMEWTDRGNLRHEYKETCFKGIALNDSIYVVVTRYDSEKIYNGTEFLIQRFDERIGDWAIVKRLYYSQHVGHFNLAVVENCLYIFYGDGEVAIYHEDLNEWKTGPAIEYGVLDVAMCMIVARPDALVCKKRRSFRVTSS